MSFKRGFTLAEVLITLSIIGVVAALTIPSLIVNNQEKETVVQLKKAYNVFSNAFSLAVIEYGDPSGWGLTMNTLEGSIGIMDKMAPYMNLMKRCDGTVGCFAPNVVYKNLDGTDNFKDATLSNRSKGILVDGMNINIWPANACTFEAGNNRLKNVCGSIGVDINGFKKPNTIGKDLFEFWITPDGIIPAGTADDTFYSLSSSCRGGIGIGCTAWILIKENTDFPPQGTGWDGETTSTP